MDARIITKALGGRWCGTYGIARCPAHDDREPSLSIRNGEQELIVNCFAGCSWQDVKAKLRRQGLLDVEDRRRDDLDHRPERQQPAADDDDEKQRIKRAGRIWRQSVSLKNTLGLRYFTERRGLHIGALDDLSHALRWHQDLNAVVALMTDAVTGEPTGVHRTFLNNDGTKRERKMLGKQGVIRLSQDSEVTLGLGISEGVEDGLRILLSGWRPVWAATSAGGIERFPVLSGIECLTIFADDGKPGMDAAKACVDRWKERGIEAQISYPKEFRDGGI
jgi:putative DNA primase/helicase